MIFRSWVFLQSCTPLVSLWLPFYLSCLPNLFLSVQIFLCQCMAVNMTLALPPFFNITR